MDNPPVPIKLRAKYLAPQGAKKNAYRARTGPNCCTKNCASGRKKNLRAQAKRR